MPFLVFYGWHVKIKLLFLEGGFGNKLTLFSKLALCLWWVMSHLLSSPSLSLRPHLSFFSATLLGMTNLLQVVIALQFTFVENATKLF